MESKSFVENILSKHRRAIPKLDSVDKWPNIDGTIDFRDEAKAETVVNGEMEGNEARG